MRYVLILLLLASPVQAMTIGIIDCDQAHFEDMAEIVQNSRPETKIIGLWGKTHKDIAYALEACIVLDVDVIAMPVQTWTFNLDIAKMIGLANRLGIRIVGAGSNNDFKEEFINEMGGCLQRYWGVEYADRSFRYSAFVNCMKLSCNSINER